MYVSIAAILKIFCLIIPYTWAETYEFGRCGNPTCSVRIAAGVTQMNYSPFKPHELAYEAGQKFDIYVRDYGKKKKQFGVVMNGKKGYVNANSVMEVSTYIQDLVNAEVEFMNVPIDSNAANPSSTSLHSSMSHHQLSSDSHVQQQFGEQDHSSYYNPQIHGVQDGFQSPNFHASSPDFHSSFDAQTEPRSGAFHSSSLHVSDSQMPPLSSTEFSQVPSSEQIPQPSHNAFEGTSNPSSWHNSMDLNPSYVPSESPTAHFPNSFVSSSQNAFIQTGTVQQIPSASQLHPNQLDQSLQDHAWLHQSGQIQPHKSDQMQQHHSDQMQVQHSAQTQLHQSGQTQPYQSGQLEIPQPQVHHSEQASQYQNRPSLHQSSHSMVYSQSQQPFQHPSQSYQQQTQNQFESVSHQQSESNLNQQSAPHKFSSDMKNNQHFSQFRNIEPSMGYKNQPDINAFMDKDLANTFALLQKAGYSDEDYNILHADYNIPYEDGQSHYSDYDSVMSDYDNVMPSESDYRPSESIANVANSIKTNTFGNPGDGIPISDNNGNNLQGGAFSSLSDHAQHSPSVSVNSINSEGFVNPSSAVLNPSESASNVPVSTFKNAEDKTIESSKMFGNNLDTNQLTDHSNSQDSAEKIISNLKPDPFNTAYDAYRTSDHLVSSHQYSSEITKEMDFFTADVSHTNNIPLPNNHGETSNIDSTTNKDNETERPDHIVANEQPIIPDTTALNDIKENELPADNRLLKESVDKIEKEKDTISKRKSILEPDIGMGRSSSERADVISDRFSEDSSLQDIAGEVKVLDVQKEEPSNSKNSSPEQVEQTFPDESINDKSILEANLNESFVNHDLPTNINLSTASANGSAKDEDAAIHHVGDFLSDPALSAKDSVNAETITPDSSKNIFDFHNPNQTSTSFEGDKSALENSLNIPEFGEVPSDLKAYQNRNLKGEEEIIESNVEALEEATVNNNQTEFDFYLMMENILEAVRSITEQLLSWIPDPLYTMIKDLEKSGISPRLAVFTALSAGPCIFLIITVVYIKHMSKEKKVVAQLILSEKCVYNLSAEKNIMEDKIEKLECEVQSSKAMMSDDRKAYEDLKIEARNLKCSIEKLNNELENSHEEICTYKDREQEYREIIADHEKMHLELLEDKSQLEAQVADQAETLTQLTSQLQEKEKEIKELQREKSEYLQSNEAYEEKLNQLQVNCNQLLKEAEAWNMRVNELTSKLSEESADKIQLEQSLKEKETETQSLTHLVQTFKSFEEFGTGEGEDSKSSEEKLEYLLNSTSILIKLQTQEGESKQLLERLSDEQSKIMSMEVDLLEAKSSNDKLKLSYNQALQDKAEAQTKLEVLTNYFKDKEIQLQKQLGVHEAVREKREKDADSAERRIILIEQENSSYKYQVASMKQEMEETERNLKTQIAVQEKKAHENWIAARAAERKLEDMKQESTQLHQRLTLLERERENWNNSERDEVLRPIPKRISDVKDESPLQDMNNSIEMRHNMFPPHLPPPHMMLPPDRPLPPLPPPHMPPFLPPMDPHFRPQHPWHMPPEGMPGPDFRITPDFSRGREMTPPRGRYPGQADGDMGPRQSSPLGGERRDSCNSTPPQSLPDFHDIPPRPFFPPPPMHHRFPMPPPYRKEFAQSSRRPDNQEDSSSGRAVQTSSVPQDSWSQSSSRV